ncbi:MAG TPA: hypothetical protein VGB50_07805 [Flavobacterium sp.]|jgi:hypothetical protein
MLHDFLNNDNKFGILFTKFSGGYWREDLNKIIKSRLSPDLMTEEIKSVGWHHTESDSKVSKDGIDFKLEISKFDDISLILLSEATEENKQKLRDWAAIISTEVEKLK